MSRVQDASNDVDVDLRKLFASLLRDWWLIVIVALIVTGAAFVLASLATPKYRAETRILIETGEAAVTLPNDSPQDSNSPVLDQEGVTSKVEVISSDATLREVAKRLNLASKPEFDSVANPSALEWIMVTLGLKSDPAEVPPEERILSAFRKQLTVYRVENSRVIVIEFSSEEPKLAAQVPSEIAKVFLENERKANKDLNVDATAWLEPEITALSKRVKEAEARVASYRAQSDLLIGQNDAVLATQQLSEISSELSRVRANRAAAEAKAESVRGVLESGASLEALPDVMSSNLIQRLRERQAQLKADIADLSTTMLENHPRVRSLRSQSVDLDGQIRREAQNVLKSLVNEAKTAQLREQQLVGDLNRMKAESARAGEEEVELRALEREATASRQLLESYLTRYREAMSRVDRNNPPVDARVFSEALTPAEPYFPKILPITAAAFVAALLIMAVITLMRELFSGRAMGPAAGARMEPVADVHMPALVSTETEPYAPEDLQPVVVPQPQARPEPKPQAQPRSLRTSLLREELRAEAPRVEPEPPVEPAAPVYQQSALGEVTIENAAEKLIAGGASRAIVISPEGDEAAATSVLVAREVADAGLRVLLLDLTASGAASLPMLDGVSHAGITNLLASEAQFTDVIHADHYSDCHVIPVGTADPARAMRAVERLPIIMDSLTTAYDVVVVECGPTDAAGIRRLVDDGSEILVSVLEPEDEVVSHTAEALRANGYAGLTLVTPIGYRPPVPPLPGRSAA